MKYYGVLINGQLYVRTRRGNYINLKLLGSAMEGEDSAETNRA